MATSVTRTRPNVLITGTPGTGKSTLAGQLANRLQWEHVEISREVMENGFTEEWDEERGCGVLDEDRLLDHIEERMDSNDGGRIVDYHGCDFFPQRWFDLVVVLRCDNTVLYDRLKARGYDEKKIRENVECEIFGTLLDEAFESYEGDIVHEMTSESNEDMQNNLDRICQLLDQLK